MAGSWTSFEEQDGKRFRTYRDADGNPIVFQLDHEAGVYYNLQWVIINDRIARGLIRNDMLREPRPEESSVASAYSNRISAANRGRHGYQLAARERSNMPGRRTDEHSRDDPGKLQRTETQDDADLNKQNLAKHSPGSRTSYTCRRTIEISATEFTGFAVELAHFFVRGRVFRAIWPEPRGILSEEDKTGPYKIYLELRPMIVILSGPAHCICAPIYSYGGKGTTKRGLKEAEIKCHAIAYSSGQEDKPLPGEEENGALMLKSFPVDTVKGVTLQKASRVRFDTPHTVSYNIRVRDMGRVPHEHRQRLVQCYKACVGDTALAPNPQKQNQNLSTPTRPFSKP